MPCRSIEPAHQRLRLLGEVPEQPRPLRPESRLEPALVAPLPGADLAAVPPRGAPADALRLEEHHVEPGPGEVQRRRQAGVAAADDADVGRHLARQRRERRVRCRGRGVPTRGIGAGPVVGGQEVEAGHASGPRRPSRPGVGEQRPERPGLERPGVPVGVGDGGLDGAVEAVLGHADVAQRPRRAEPAGEVEERRRPGRRRRARGRAAPSPRAPRGRCRRRRAAAGRRGSRHAAGRSCRRGRGRACGAAPCWPLRGRGRRARRRRARRRAPPCRRGRRRSRAAPRRAPARLPRPSARSPGCRPGRRAPRRHGRSRSARWSPTAPAAATGSARRRRSPPRAAPPRIAAWSWRRPRSRRGCRSSPSRHRWSGSPPAAGRCGARSPWRGRSSSRRRPPPARRPARPRPRPSPPR